MLTRPLILEMYDEMLEVAEQIYVQRGAEVSIIEAEAFDKALLKLIEEHFQEIE